MWLTIYSLALVLSIGACAAAVLMQPKEHRSQPEM
jgi:hypothetical protein